jgi:probable rRNA maturation factor
MAVVFVGARAIRELNRRFRRKDCATDVLSFHYDGEMLEGIPLLGEIFIAPEISHRQAHLWRNSPDKELKRLVLHGILHLQGYDHERDEGVMFRLQSQLLRRRQIRTSAPLLRVGRVG